MGFEQVVPPIPDRKQQIEGINRLQKNWASQPYYKYYMNESLRQPKLAYSNRINRVYMQFWTNLALSTAILLPVALLCRRFFLYRSGIPTTNLPNYFHKERTDNQIRQSLHFKYIMPAFLFSASFLSWALTDWEPIYDMKYQYVHKTPKMM